MEASTQLHDFLRTMPRFPMLSGLCHSGRLPLNLLQFAKRWGQIVKPLESQKASQARSASEIPPSVLFLCGPCLSAFPSSRMKGRRRESRGYFFLILSPCFRGHSSDGSCYSPQSWLLLDKLPRASSPCPLEDNFLPPFMPSDPELPNHRALHHLLSVSLPCSHLCK